MDINNPYHVFPFFVVVTGLYLLWFKVSEKFMDQKK